MKDFMEYKGYQGSIHFDEDNALFFGQVKFVRSLISYEASNAKKFRAAFEGAVDDYLELCGERGVIPEKPFKGSFNVRVKPELHRRAMLVAQRKGVSLNKLVSEALERVTSF